MTDQQVSKDAWLLQAIGGSTKYGNGDGDLLHVGRVPSGSGAPDWKSRSVFEVVLRNGGGTGILDSLTALSAVTFELTVAPNTCITGGRGAVFYAFLEEMSTDFSEKTAASDCAFGSGTGNGVWGADSGAVTTNRAFKSSPGLTTGDKVAWNILTMATAWLADTSKLTARFRIIYANSGGTAYDETAAAARGTSFYSFQHATSGNHPVLHVTGSSGSVAKSGSDTVLITESQSKSATGTAPEDADTILITDAHTFAGLAPTWEVVADGADEGKGKVTLRRSVAHSTTTLLDGVSEEDVQLQARFSVNKIPSQQWIAFWLMGRAIDSSTAYSAVARMNTDNTISISLFGSVAGVTTSLGTVEAMRALIASTDYWIKFLILGTTPTTLAAKIWRNGEAEPDGWHITAQDSESSLQAPGTVGMRASISSVSNVPIAITFDEFTAVEPVV